MAGFTSSLLIKFPLSLSLSRAATCHHAPPLLRISLSHKLSLPSLRRTHSLSHRTEAEAETETEKCLEAEITGKEETPNVKSPKRGLLFEARDETEKGFEAEIKEKERVSVKLPKGALYSIDEDETEMGFEAEVKEEKDERFNVKLPKRAFGLGESEIESSNSEAESESEKGFGEKVKGEGGESVGVKLPKRDSGWVKLPSLSVKEKKEIGSYAHSLGKKLKSQQVGKGGVTEAVGVALVESLEKNELLKIKIHNNCPGEIEDNVKRLEELTGSVVVGQIGRTVILYRPSMTKLKAEEKKKHVLQVVSRRRQAFKSSSENRGLVPTEHKRGRRGSSRYSSPL